MKFWVCSKCDKVVDHELEIVEVVDDLYPIKEESGRVHAVPQSSYRLFCSTCINHITGNSAGFPVHPSMPPLNSMPEGIWVTEAVVDNMQADMAARVLKYVDPQLHKVFTLLGNEWRWKEYK